MYVSGTFPSKKTQKRPFVSTARIPPPCFAKPRTFNQPIKNRHHPFFYYCHPPVERGVPFGSSRFSIDWLLYFLFNSICIYFWTRYFVVLSRKKITRRPFLFFLSFFLDILLGFFVVFFSKLIAKTKWRPRTRHRLRC